MTTTRKPKKQTSVPPIKPPRRKMTCTASIEPSHTYVFEAELDGVPAEMSMIVFAKNGPDALGAAYLLADHFACECMKLLKQKDQPCR
jgi:hypothetical protein